METIHQNNIFRAMEAPDFYPHPVSSIEQRETHISRVFLTGTYVYKVKKAVDLKFLDFSTLEKRKYFCRREVILNRRLTSGVYTDVLPITFEDGGYCLDGPGEPVEYTVKMRQLSESRSLSHLLESLSNTTIKKLAVMLAEFYDRSSTSEEINALGSWETVRDNCMGNFKLTENFVGDILDERKYQIIRAVTESFLNRRKALFQHRIEQGKVRDCHGDLRTEHIYLDDGIQIIDCIEFNDNFRYQDPTSDLAFLAMDLDFLGFSQIGLDLIQAYMKHTKDRDIYILLDFYKCYRAFVRCKVNCFRLQEKDLDNREKRMLLKETDKYLNLAYQYAIRFTRPTLWVVCGMPASGKTTVSSELAKELEIQAFHSDVVRKELFREKSDESMDVPFESGIYSKGASSLTYGRLLLLAQEEIKKGNSVILDATFSTKHRREEAVQLSKDEDVNIIFIECISSMDSLKERLHKRETAPSISDARIHHLDEFQKRYEPLDEVRDEMHIRVDTKKTLATCMEHVLSLDYVLTSKLMNHRSGE